MSKWLFIILLFLSFCSIKPEGEKQVTKQLLTSGKFVFKAQTALPLSGRSVTLSEGYDITISRDTVTAYLPYYGRAYSAPIDPSSGGFKFTSTNFEYQVQDRDKGGWDVFIKPKDYIEARELSLTIFANGSATLQVLGNNRQPISFSGTVIAK